MFDGKLGEYVIALSVISGKQSKAEKGEG